MEKKDMALLIEVEDELQNMDQTLEQLAGHGLRYEEFIADLIAFSQILYRKNKELKSTVQSQSGKLMQLEKRLSALETKTA